MSTCLGKLIAGIAGLLFGSAKLADGAHKRKTLSVALGLMSALGGIALLCASAYDWLTGEETELDDEDEEAPADNSKTEAPAEEAAPVQEEAE